MQGTLSASSNDSWRCMGCGYETARAEQVCPGSCREPVKNFDLGGKGPPRRLWLIRRQESELLFFPPNHFAPVHRKRK